MNIQNMIELFSRLGIQMVIDENGKMTFFDTKTNTQMKAFYTKSPLPILGNDDMDYDVSLDKAMRGGRIISKSSNYGLSFRLTNPIIDRKRTDDVIIDYMEYTTAENGVVIEGTTVSFENGRNSNVSIETNNQQGYSKLVMFSDGQIMFSQEGKVGYYDEGYDDEYQLSEQEMKNILNNSSLANSVSDYYSPIFPKMKESIVTASKSRTL